LSLLKNPKLLKKIIDLSVDKIQILASRLADSNITSMSYISLTLILLFHLKQYTVGEVTAWIFEIPTSTFNNLIWKCIHSLYCHYVNKIIIPPLEDRLDQSVKFYSYLVVMVGDGMEQHCVMSVDKHKAKKARSGKKQAYTITKFLGVSVRGLCWYYSKSYLGSLNDMNVASFQSIIHDLNNLTEKEAVILDSGYIGLERVWKSTNVLTPYKYVSEKLQKYENLRFYNYDSRLKVTLMIFLQNIMKCGFVVQVSMMNLFIQMA